MTLLNISIFLYPFKPTWNMKKNRRRPPARQHFTGFFLLWRHSHSLAPPPLPPRLLPRQNRSCRAVAPPPLLCRYHLIALHCLSVLRPRRSSVIQVVAAQCDFTATVFSQAQLPPIFFCSFTLLSRRATAWCMRDSEEVLKPKGKR
jgi:hypothetical protein